MCKLACTGPRARIGRPPNSAFTKHMHKPAGRQLACEILSPLQHERFSHSSANTSSPPPRRRPLHRMPGVSFDPLHLPAYMFSTWSRFFAHMPRPSYYGSSGSLGRPRFACSLRTQATRSSTKEQQSLPRLIALAYLLLTASHSRCGTPSILATQVAIGQTNVSISKERQSSSLCSHADGNLGVCGCMQRHDSASYQGWRLFFSPRAQWLSVLVCIWL
jgi:hypothetical protein